MKFNNKLVKYYSLFVYLLILICFKLAFVINLFPLRRFYTLSIIIFIIMGVVLLSVHLYLGPQFFEFDSEGEVINITCSYQLLSLIFPSTRRHAEFPKQKLICYQVKKNIIKKTLILTLQSRKNGLGYSKIKFNATYLNNTKLGLLEKQLGSIIEEYNASKNQRGL